LQGHGRLFHGRSGHDCYLPLYITCGKRLLCARLRQSNIDAAAGDAEELARIVSQLRAAWPKLRIIIRGDSGVERKETIVWCEADRVECMLDLAHALNKRGRLDASRLRWRSEAQQEFLDTLEVGCHGSIEPRGRRRDQHRMR
jgi:hypothetical protein